MNLNKAPAQYSQADQDQTRRTLTTEDQKNIKAGQILNSFLMRDTVTGTVKTVTIASGAFVIT